MRHTSALVLAGVLTSAHAQNVLFEEHFEAPPAHFTLNTADAGSISGVSNTWVINSTYAGGSGTADCSGFPLDFSIGATAGQPAGIQPANGNYLHTASLVALDNGIGCCSFGAADGFCTDPDDVFARMDLDVSTVGYSQVTLRFWWLCNGGNQNYGEVYYSTDGGLNWTQLTTPLVQYRNTTTWSEQTATIPAFAGQGALRFGFRFHNGTSFLGGNDPGFAIDDVRIEASTPGSIACTASPLLLCTGSPLDVPYTINGTFTAGNTFSVQLSDANGGFGNPTFIGSVMSTSAGTIPCTIPPSTPPGSGYRVRVVSDQPVVVGADNGADIGVVVGPNAGTDASVTACSNDVPTDLSTYLGVHDAGGMWSGPDGNGVFTYVVTSTSVCPSDTAFVTVTTVEAPNAGGSSVATICKNTGSYDLFSFLTGSPDGTGSWTDPNNAPFSGTFDSNSGTAGIYTYVVAGMSPCAQDESVVTVELGDDAQAGPDADWVACSSSAPLDLYTMLTDAHTNGVWYNGGGPFDGITSLPGTFTYVDFGEAPCPNDTAHITLSFVMAVSAGENTTITLCTNAPPTDLLTLLNGSPDAGGSWTDPNGSAFAGTFTPGSSSPGLYTYHVTAPAPCPDDEAVAAVIVQACTGVEEFSASAPLAFRGNMGGDLLFDATLDHADLWLFDAAGRVIDQRTGISTQGTLLLPVPHLVPGTYSLLMREGARQRSVRFSVAGE